MALENATIDNFLIKSSWVGLLTLYYVKLMYDKKTAFTKQDLEKIRSGEYTYGYLIACVAFDLLTVTRNGDILNITSFNEYLSSNLYKRLQTVVEDNSQANSNLNWKDDLLRIQKLAETSLSV